MLSKKAKMNRSKFLPARSSKPVFRNPMHHRELTKAAGWKWDRLYVPLHHFLTTTPAPLKKFARPPEKPFSTASTQSGALPPSIDAVRKAYSITSSAVSSSVMRGKRASPGGWLGAPRPYRPLPRSLRRRSHCLISCLNVRFRLRYVGANACKNFKHLRLLIGG